MRLSILILVLIILSLAGLMALSVQLKALHKNIIETAMQHEKAIADIEKENAGLKEEIAHSRVLRISDAAKIISSILECESSWRPHAVNHKTKVGKDYSYFQINSHYHSGYAREMGLDIKDPSDNLKYGLYLLGKEGLRPWSASMKCIERKFMSQTGKTLQEVTG